MVEQLNNLLVCTVRERNEAALRSLMNECATKQMCESFQAESNECDFFPMKKKGVGDFNLSLAKGLHSLNCGTTSEY